MKIEIHILQNFSPSNLNRDDTGAPKECVFGGYRRARVSSQCQKRAIRQAFVQYGLLDETSLAARTKRLVRRVADELVSRHGRPEAEAVAKTRSAIEGLGLGVKDDKGEIKTEYLIFLPHKNLQEIAEIVHRNWEKLDVEDEPGEEAAEEPEKRGRSAAAARKARKQKAKATLDKELQKELEAVVARATGAVDLALFGRMMADKPDWNVDAACQVAHAISTNRLESDFDFYTAVDDLKPDDTAGSDMMGTIGFNSSCFYRYAVVDVRDLQRNLGGDGKLTESAIEAFIRANYFAIPSGKQNSMAAHNPPSYMLVIAREAGMPISLANAFLKPIRPTRDDDLVAQSIAALEAYMERVTKMQGKIDRSQGWSISDRDLLSPSGATSERADDLDGLVERILDQVRQRIDA